LKTTVITEERSTYKIDTYGTAFQIARGHLIDDNVGLLNDIPMVIGNDLSKGIANTFFSTLTGTTATTDFFTSGHNDLLHHVLDFNGLTSAAAGMRTPKDISRGIVGIIPTTLMVPAVLDFIARQLLNSAQLFRDQTTDLRPSGNPLLGINLQLAIEPRLDANSVNDWYVFSISLHGAVLVALLGGKLGPTVETSPHTHDTLGLSLRGYAD
jgi:hypothetical protein